MHSVEFSENKRVKNIPSSSIFMARKDTSFFSVLFSRLSCPIRIQVSYIVIEFFTKFKVKKTQFIMKKYMAGRTNDVLSGNYGRAR